MSVIKSNPFDTEETGSRQGIGKASEAKLLQVEGEAVEVERAVTQRGELKLQRRGEHYELISGGSFLMATYNGESERLLVSAALDVCRTDSAHVLIGGLGVGYSLAEAVRHPRCGLATVIEIEDKVIEWNRRFLHVYSNDAIFHPRARVICADLLEWISESEEAGERYNAICLDIDNGPDWTVFESNAALYGDGGLDTLYRLLAPGGALSFWSASRSPELLLRLERKFGQAEEIAGAKPERGEPDYVYVGRKREYRQSCCFAVDRLPTASTSIEPGNDANPQQI
ncbi:spermine/spermidine synthase [Saccharibacillus sp. CPCC 101409]|uniref:spermidine synthase n=1 Tax=Saccharibacillus sp. CPCC 101409 TaxID=3058041 RepID=UPI002672877C|nr:spermine/spermidine synthase [Saccharibacillus sp. CPCC 101409]MDO3412177.1 spermine/spermidine synthase [Saccharibacillus sp. CPCC 101409]